MTRSEFSKKCKELEADGWTIDTFEPHAKFAIYRKNGKSQQIGVKK